MLDQFHMKLTKAFATRYRKSSKKEKTQLLNEYCVTSGVKRKAAIKRLHRKPVLPTYPLLPLLKKSDQKRVKLRKKKYLSLHSESVYKAWHLSGCICAERLQPVLREYLDALIIADKLRLQTYDLTLLEHIPVISLKRIIADFEEVRYARQFATPPRGAPALYKRIPISASFGKRTTEAPGLFEVDYVEHTGGVKTGRFVVTSTYADIVSQWTVRAAGWGQNLESIRGMHHIATGKVYHPIREYHPDNAPALLRCLFEKMEEIKLSDPLCSISVSRSRPYEKNDNAHVEQKNDDKVRRLVGYHRYDTQEQVTILNRLYGVTDAIDNFFIPSQKLVKKVADTKGKVLRRIHDKPQTPYSRLITDRKIDEELKTALTKIKSKLNLVELVQQRDSLLQELRATTKRKLTIRNV